MNQRLIHQKKCHKPGILFFFLIILLFNICYSTKACGQTSLIASALESKKSLVHITALQFAIKKSPHTSAALDPRTGRIIIAQKVIAAQASKTGAGVIISCDGLIVTNLHTVKGAEKIAVHLFNSRLTSAKVLHILPKHDLALLKIDAGFPLTPIEFADSNHVKLRDEVIVIGNSKFLKETLSGGRVIGIGTSHLIKNKNLKSIELIEINIDLHKGDSGGPLLDRQGRLIGMIAAELRAKQSSFAIPSNKIKKLYLDFIK